MWIKWGFLLSVFFITFTSLNALDKVEKKPSKIIVFDFGGVIAKSDKNQLVHFIAETLHISENEALAALAQLKKDRASEQNEQRFWIAYADAKGIKLPPDWEEKLDDARFQSTKAIPGMIELVKNLQKQGYQTALLSNIRENRANIKRKLGYYNLFNPTLFSYEIGVKKPNTEAYKILLERLKVPPQAVIFIDNREDNVEAARAVGLDGIVFVNSEQLTQELKKRGIEANPSSDK